MTRNFREALAAPRGAGSNFTGRRAALAGATLMLLAACSTPAQDEDAAGDVSTGDTADGEGVVVAFVPGIASDPFFRAMELAAREEAESLGIELIWQGAADEYSPQSQLPFVDSALAEDIDALVLVPTDADALQPSVDRAAEMGIPVITVDTTVSDQSELVSHITGDNLDGGQQAAAEMSRQLDGSGKILLISASPTNTTGTERVRGFEESAAQDHPGLDVLEVQYAYSQPANATTILTTTLLAEPDLAGVFAVDGTSCTGAVAALENADAVGEVTLLCYDAYANQVEDLERGAISALVAQDPAQEARLALQYALSAVTGEGENEIESSVVIPNVIMNVENLDETRHYEYAE